MATLNQQAAPLNLTGVAGSPFSLVVLGASVISSPVVAVTNQFGNDIVGGNPTVTTPTGNELLLSWSTTQTSAIANAQAPAWSLSGTVASVGPQALLGGHLAFVPSTYPAASTAASTSLSVNVGTNVVDLTVTLVGGGGG